MANAEHEAMLREGIKEWNRWRSEHQSVVHPDLSGIDFVRWGPSYSYYFQDLPDAPFRDANFEGVDFRHAALLNADLRGVNLTNANLDYAVLSFAHLQSAIVAGTSLYRTKLSGARFGRTIISNVDFENTSGLASVVHDAPSTVGIDTLEKSHGNIPEPFLLGCGVSDAFINYSRSLSANPNQFYSCFISYSSSDQDFAERLHADMQAAGVRCWFAPHDLRGGSKVHEQINIAIRNHEKLLLILSPASISSSWVEVEIREARKREVDQGVRVLFPIRLTSYQTLREWTCFDTDTVKDLAVEVREYFIPDFSNWKAFESYRVEFDRLLRDLSQVLT